MYANVCNLIRNESETYTFSTIHVGGAKVLNLQKSCAYVNILFNNDNHSDKNFLLWARYVFENMMVVYWQVF